MLASLNNKNSTAYMAKTGRSVPIDVDSRFELKYRLTYFQYLKLRNAIRPYMEMDSYTSAQPSRQYPVRSLYFDTLDYRLFHQKMSGDSDRAKFRLRTYPHGDEYLQFVRVELKMRQGIYSIKKSVFVPMDEYEHFMHTRHWRTFDDPITNAFERQLLTQNLRPVVLVEYDREGYQARLKSNLRITFDHRVRSSHARSLFPNINFYRYLYPRSVILEIKFNDTLPNWLEKLVRSQGLNVIANSKYTQSVLIARNDLHHPGNVILVR
jgi:SPX domain protein involved in polyphosphate accumulation